MEKSYASRQILPPPSLFPHVHPRFLEIKLRIAVTKGSEQRELIASAVRLLYPFVPREKQVDCLCAMAATLYRKEDPVLVAKTSFGKSSKVVIVTKMTVIGNLCS